MVTERESPSSNPSSSASSRAPTPPFVDSSASRYMMSTSRKSYRVARLSGIADPLVDERPGGAAAVQRDQVALVHLFHRLVDAVFADRGVPIGADPPEHVGLTEPVRELLRVPVEVVVDHADRLLDRDRGSARDPLLLRGRAQLLDRPVE